MGGMTMSYYLTKVIFTLTSAFPIMTTVLKILCTGIDTNQTTLY